MFLTWELHVQSTEEIDDYKYLKVSYGAETVYGGRTRRERPE